MRDLRRRVGAHAEHAAGQRIDDLRTSADRVAAGAGQQRLEVLDQRRLDEPVAACAKVVEHAAAQRLDPGLGRQDVLDRLGRIHLRMVEHEGKPMTPSAIDASPMNGSGRRSSR